MGTLVKLFAVAFIALAFAGCVEDDRGEQTDQPTSEPQASPSPTAEREQDRSNETLKIQIEAQGDWRVAVPLPVSEPGTSAEDWEANLTRDGDAKTALVETEHGTVLEVTGNDFVTLQSHVTQPPLRGNRCCAEAYLDAEWSAGKDDDGNVRAGAWEGSIILEIRYEARSQLCSRTDHYVGEGEAPIAAATEDDPHWFPLGGERRAACQ